MSAILLAAISVAASAQQSNQGARTWALVIGISKYQKLPGGQQLQFADRDAALFADTIQKRGVSAQNVKLLTGAEATAAAIKSAIGNWLARSASESDTVVIFFSGHGFFEREFGESYLLGYDSDPKDPYASALSVSELGQALDRRVRSGRVLVIADALRRDFFDPESEPDSARSFAQAFDQMVASRPGISAVIGSGPGEFSREGQRWGGHGVFTKHLADVLFDGADPNGNVAVAASELFDLLKARIADDTSSKQHPWRSGTAVAQRGMSPSQPPKQVAEAKTDRDPAALTKSTGKKSEPDRPVVTTRTTTPPPASEKKSVHTDTAEKRVEPVSIVNEKKPDPATIADNKKADTVAVPRRAPQPVVNATDASRRASSTTAPAPAATSTASDPKPIQPAKPVLNRLPTPPGSEPIHSTQPASASREPARAEVAVAELPTPPKPVTGPPGTVVVSSERAIGQPEVLSASVPTTRAEAAPSPLILQLEAAIASKNLLEPRNANAWDFYQRLASDSSAAADLTRLRPRLADALALQGRAIVSGDVRGDNISDKVEDFKRAGQMLARARTLAPDNAAVIALEKLSAAEALIALQFYDEAERALTQLQNAKLAAIENALGLLYHGKLDSWRAERAFKRAIEVDGQWAAPHYNLALLYRSQQNQGSLAEFEAAAALDPNNASLLAALGDEYFTRQQWKQATDTFRKAVAVKPSDDTLHTKLGHALYSQGRQDEANREYQRARELRGKQP